MASNCDNVVHHARQELTGEDKKYAAAHLNETDETRENAVAEIRRWIEESDDLRAQIGKRSYMADALKSLGFDSIIPVMKQNQPEST